MLVAMSSLLAQVLPASPPLCQQLNQEPRSSLLMTTRSLADKSGEQPQLVSRTPDRPRKKLPHGLNG
jgi:hypothetical protein